MFVVGLHADNAGPSVAACLPRNHLERERAAIWGEVLGGYSLLAVRVMNRIEKTFGKRLPVTALFQMPTIEQLAQLVRREASLTPWSSLVPLQPGGSRLPFFWIHGEASDAILPRFLGSEHPLDGLLHQAHDGPRRATPRSRTSPAIT